MKKFSRIAALVLSAALLTGCLSGCDSPSAATTEPADDVVQQLVGIPGDTVMMTVGGKEVTAETYLYWLGYTIDYMVYYYYGSADGLDWSDATLSDYLRSNAAQTVQHYEIAAVKAAEQGVTLDDEDQTAIDGEIQAMRDDYDTDEAYQDRLKQSCLDENGFRAILEQFYLYNDLNDFLFADGGTYAPTDADLESYIADNGVYRAKHILLLTQDTSTKTSYDEATIASQKAIADDLLAQLRASSDPLTLFDTLMNEYSEDTGLAENPDGYLTSSGKMVAEFETAALALNVGKISDVVQSSYGYHIIQRLAVEPSDCREDYVAARFDALLAEWLDSAEVTYTDAYTNLDIQAFYTALATLRNG